MYTISLIVVCDSQFKMSTIYCRKIFYLLERSNWGTWPELQPRNPYKLKHELNHFPTSFKFQQSPDIILSYENHISCTFPTTMFSPSVFVKQNPATTNKLIFTNFPFARMALFFFAKAHILIISSPSLRANQPLPHRLSSYSWKSQLPFAAEAPQLSGGITVVYPLPPEMVREPRWNPLCSTPRAPDENQMPPGNYTKHTGWFRKSEMPTTRRKKSFTSRFFLPRCGTRRWPMNCWGMGAFYSDFYTPQLYADLIKCNLLS